MKFKQVRHIASLLILPAAILLFLDSCKKETDSALPRISTALLTNVTSVSAECGGIIQSDGGDPIVAKGVCWSDHPGPTLNNTFTSDGEGDGSFASKMTGLTNGTNYYVRAYATNNTGTSFGNEYIFMTPLTDIDGNLYNTVRIGNQTWMTLNLKTTKLNDRTPIPDVTDNQEWSALRTAAFCWYKNDESSNKNPYGALYNWYAVNTGKLCPEGWHVPDE